jgi:epoxyqueuosine reductase
VEFIHQGKRYHTIIPPTYIFSGIRKTCKDILSNILGKKGYHVERAILPMKLLAVRSGLGKYGKNNICYVDGMGSYTRLEAFYTDYPFPNDSWQEKKLMKACASCSICQRACPTQCIPQDRILIHADHCLTHFNENIGKFPAFIPPQAHHALVGCIQCQIVCPQNKKYFDYYQNTIVFSEEETACMLLETPQENIPQTLSKKLKNLDMYEYYPELPRNLMALVTKINNGK